MSEGRIRREGVPGGTPARNVAGSVPWAGRRRSAKARLLRPRAIAWPPFELVSERWCPVRGRGWAARAPPGVGPPKDLLFTTEGKVKLCDGI
jgi:hypothetical protein